MKKLIRILGTIILMFLIATCGIDYRITTRINPDGSCERLMIARLDSSDLTENPFFIPIDSSWKKTIEMKYDSAEKKTIAIVTVKKKYSSVDEMNKEFFQKDKLSEAQNLTMNLKKSFRWFYTKYRYEETYVQQFPFRNFPISDYFTAEEIKVCIHEDPIADSVYYAGKDSTERSQIEEVLEKKLENFLYENIFEDFYSELMRTSQRSDHIFFKTIRLNEEKERLMNEFRDCLNILKDNCNDTSAVTLLMKLDILYQTNAFIALGTIDSLAFKTFDQKLNLDFFAPINEKYEHNLLLPGTLLNTNAQKITDGTPQWSFDLTYYVYRDFTMWAESKKTNIWAYVIAAFLMIASVITGIIQIRSKPA